MSLVLRFYDSKAFIVCGGIERLKQHPKYAHAYNRLHCYNLAAIKRWTLRPRPTSKCAAHATTGCRWWEHLS